MATLNVNGRARAHEAEPDTPLLWVLREQLGLTGTKYGCGLAQCGACTVHIDGVAVRSCVRPVSTIEPADRITTSEGDRCRALESELASRSQAHETTRQTLQLLRGRLHEALSLSTDGASDKDIFERIEQLSTAQTTIRAHDLKHIESLGQRIRDLERQIQQERKQYHAGAQAVAERLRNIMSTCFGGSRSGDLYFQLADMEKWRKVVASSGAKAF